jgi:hypothetical protein
MTHADDLDDAEAGRADLTALLTPDPAEWTPYDWNPAANRCPTHGTYMPHAATHYQCPRCWHDRYDATIDHHHTP